MSLRETFLVNKNDETINPAIEEKQQEIIDILNRLGSGAATTLYETKPNVAKDIWTTVLDYSPSKKVALVRFYLTGTADAKARLVIDDNPIIEARNSVAKKDIDITFLGSEINLNASSSIEIQVYHWTPGLQEYSATIFIKDRE